MVQRLLINNPKLDSEQLCQFIIDICGGKLSKSGENFLKVLIAAERIGLASEVFSLFEQKRAAAEGIIDSKEKERGKEASEIVWVRKKEGEENQAKQLLLVLVVVEAAVDRKDRLTVR